MSKEAMKLALEALEMYCEHGAILRPLETRDAIKEALAKQEHGEPVAYLHDDGSWTAAKTDAGRKLNDEILFIGAPKIGVYTTPQQRTWEGLSVFEINDLVENTEYEDYSDLVERTEAKLKEKNTK